MTDDDPKAADIDDIDVDPAGPVPLKSPRFATGLWGAPTPIFVPSKSTPLEEDGEGVIPPAALWAMKYRRHFHLGSRREEEFFRAVLGDSADPVYVLDDGAKHHIVGRQVGMGEDGLGYFLIGRITIDLYEHFARDDVDVAGIFTEADDLSLCSVYESTDGPSNVLLVQRYEGIDQVPADYLPSNPMIRFSIGSPGEG